MARPNRLRNEKDHNAPFYQLMRDAERGVLSDFLLVSGGSMVEAAKLLGVSYAYAHRRAQLLGGVLPDDPRREPFEPRVKDEEHQDDDSTAEESDDDSDHPTDDVDGKTHSADAS